MSGDFPFETMETYTPMEDTYFELSSALNGPHWCTGSELYDDDAASDEADAAEIEQMLYSQIYFEHNEITDTSDHQGGELSDLKPQVHIEEQENMAEVSKHHNSVAPMLNFSARNFMSPDASNNRQTQNEGMKDEEGDHQRKRKQSENDISVIEIDSTADESEEKIPSKKLKMISEKKSVKHTESRPKEKLVILSDSDFEVEKLTEKQMAVKKRKIKNLIDDDKAPHQKRKKNETKGKKKTISTPVISLESSDSEGSIMVLGDSGVFVENDNISVNAVGMSGDMQYSHQWSRPNNLSQICLEEWEGDPPLSVTQVHKLLKPDSWRISDDDLYGLQNPRYYGKQRGPQCRNCNERGHVERRCPKPRKVPACIQCGERGHIKRKCPQTMCYNCSRPGHTNNECDKIKKSYRVTCNRCGCQGHMQFECPEIWRQFHVTTSYGQLEGPKQREARDPYCYNCGEQGHFGYDCNEEGMHGFWYPVPPCATSYDFLDKKTGMPNEHGFHGTRYKGSYRRVRKRHHSQQPSQRETAPYQDMDVAEMSSAKKAKKVERESKKLRKQRRIQEQKQRVLLKNTKKLKPTNDFETSKKIKKNKSKKKNQTDDEFIPIKTKHKKKGKKQKKGRHDEVDLTITIPHRGKRPSSDHVPRTIFDSEVVDFPRGDKKSRKERFGKNVQKSAKRKELAALEVPKKTLRKANERGFNANFGRIR